MANIRARKNKLGKIISYEIRVFKGRDSSGKQLQPYVMTWRPEPNMTDKQIEKELNTQAVIFEQKCKHGLAVDTRQSFQQYAEYVISLKERNGIKHSTLTRYKDLLGRITPIIGYLKLADIRPAHLNKLYEELSKPGQNKRTGSCLSNKTILEYHRLISSIFTQAEKELIIPYNPANRATPPKVQHKEAAYFEIEDIERIRDCLEKEPIKWKTLMHLFLITGARRGEIAGLKWKVVDWENNQIHICHNLLYSADIGIYETTTKNTTSDRYVKLPSETMELLKQYQKWYNNQKDECGSWWKDTDYLFVQDNGSPMHPDSITDYMTKFSKKYELPHIHPHKFRHTMASILYFNGVDSISISKRLGHAKVSTTTDIYSHIIKKADEKSAECIADAILRTGKNGS